MEAYALKVTIRSPGEPALELGVDADSALVGSGAHCEVRLRAEDADREQLSLRAESGGVFAQARSQTPPALLNGVPFVQGRLLPDSVLQIGRVLLTVTVVETTLSPNAHRRRGEHANPAVYVLGAVGFPLGFYWLFTMTPPERGLPASVPPPPLWTDAAPARCPEQEARAAQVLGDKELLEATSARERAPFDAEDGIAAKSLFERAAACFTVAGNARDARSASDAASELETRMKDEFHVHRVRLERSLATRRYEDARTEVRILLTFVGRQEADYTRWLSDLDRQIELKFAGKKNP